MEWPKSAEIRPQRSYVTIELKHTVGAIWDQRYKAGDGPAKAA